MRLSGKVAIVTGGASGIGRATCLLFAAEGAAVFVADIDADGAQETVQMIAAQGGKAQFAQADAGQEAECGRMVAECLEAYGQVDVLVNNAATFILKGIEATPEDWQAIMATNVFGYSYMMRYAADAMQRQGGGSIVNVGSISSAIAQAGLLTYNATKGAVLQLTRCAALDLYPHNIRVNCVCPGSVWTKQVQKMAAAGGWTKEQTAAEIGGMQIMKRVGEPSEIAYPILFFASEESSFCTGSILYVDGGYTAQ
jgi:NAD(P)-dependent dehydrogenase (short-subunit alcohol dehydrogenase family)